MEVTPKAFQETLETRWLAVQRARVSRKVGGEAIDRPHHLVRIAEVQILVQSAIDEIDPPGPGAGVVQSVRHRAGTDFIFAAVENEQRNLQLANDAQRVEQTPADQMQRQARIRSAGDLRQRGERGLQNQPVEWKAPDELGGDRAAERVTVENRRHLLRPDLVVEAS